ncbi:MAG: glycerophosphodiester phosphodiesterase [Clostridia bacterium]|nr:glycerophosphodiester phosphodiesterase [Clostridia bacterium]
MTAVWILLGVLLFLILLYLLVLIRPRRPGSVDPALLCNYAHRGRHGGAIPENSMAAFALACEEGVGIELDVQLSRDGKVMVFHDYSLRRMTGCERLLSEMDAKDLQALSLAGTQETVPTLEQVLRLVRGRVPLLIELKGESMDTSLCQAVAELLAGYEGAYCIESFHPLLVREIQRHIPGVFCGLLYTNVCREKKKTSLLNLHLTWMALNFLARPQFIAYDQQERNSLPVRITTRWYKAPHFVWTARTAAQRRIAEELGEHAIFEIGTRPEEESRG